MSTQELILTEELRQKAIGLESPPKTVEIEKGAIIRFAEAVEDPNPLWNDEAEARKTRYGGLIAPPTFLRSIRLDPVQLPFEVPYKRVLDGGSEWEYFEPVRPGDRITAVARIADIMERRGSLGPMLFIINLITYTNQFGQVVATQRSTLIRY
jgi:acyl dehydratase